MQPGQAHMQAQAADTGKDEHMDHVKIIEAKESLLAENDKDADRLRRELKEQGTFYINIMSSPGSGKTSSLKQIIKMQKDRSSLTRS